MQGIQDTESILMLRMKNLISPEEASEMRGGCREW